MTDNRSERDLAERAAEGEDIAARLAESFDAAGQAIEQSLERAARSGEASFERLAARVLMIFADLAIDQVIARPLEQGLSAVLGRALGGLAGARAEGGPVVAGASYLVGERGPEIFTPQTSGAVGPTAARPVNVQVSVHGTAVDEAGIQRMQSTLVRAVMHGQRQL